MDGYERDPKISLIFIAGTIFLATLIGHLSSKGDKEIEKRGRIESICDIVSYTHPDSVRSYYKSDLNGDGIREDFILTLKDGRNLKFVLNKSSQRYELRN